MEMFTIKSSLPIFPVDGKSVKGDYEVLVQADEVSDGYHTMHELYQHRMALNVALFHALKKEYEVVKSKLHYDGTMFEGDYFVVVAKTPYGQISYHYTMKHWDKFDLSEVERVPWPYDGHTPNDVIERLLKL